MPPMRLELIQNSGDAPDPSRFQEVKAKGRSGYVFDFDPKKGESILAISADADDKGGLITRHDPSKTPLSSTSGSDRALNPASGKVVEHVSNEGVVEVPFTTKEMGQRILRVTHVKPI